MNGTVAQTGQVDVEALIEGAKAAVSPEIRRRRLRVSAGPSKVSSKRGVALAARANTDPVRMRRMIVTLLRLVAALVPRGAHIAVEARADDAEMTARISATSPAGIDGRPADLSHVLGQQATAITAASRAAQRQGGLLWLELAGGAGLELCMTLPVRSGKQPAWAARRAELR